MHWMHWIHMFAAASLPVSIGAKIHIEHVAKCYKRVDVQHGSRNRSSHSATQPLCQRGWTSHSATLPERLDQPLSHSATLAERLTQPLSHSATLSDWVAEWLVQPLLPERLSGWVAAADWLEQPLSHSVIQSGCSSHSAAATQPLSHSGRAADAATQPLSHSEWLSGWVAGEPLECKQYYPDLIFLRSG